MGTTAAEIQRSVQTDTSEPQSSQGLLAMKNMLITTISTFLSHYFTSQFIQSRWLLWDTHSTDGDGSPESVNRKVLEMKARFLYCLRHASRELLRYPGDFRSISAFEEDKINDRLEIISTPEREWMDLLLNRCTDILAGDMSSIELTEGKAGQFLRRVLRVVRHDLHSAEHIKFLYLFTIWKMPDVLFDTTICNLVRKREIRALINDPRVPKELVREFQSIRGGGLFPETPFGEVPIDEGWDIEAKQAAKTPPRPDSAWRRLFTRRKVNT